jgi:glycosyltransferase involved in cell wall biosynthesis
MPEYLHYANTFGSTLITYDDLAVFDPGLASALTRQHALHWGMAGLVFSTGAPFAQILTSGEDIGFPLALDAALHGLSVPICILTHGFLFREARLMRVMRRLDNVHFLCLSETIRDSIIDRFCISEERVVNAGYGVDTTFFQSRSEPMAPFTIASAGTANRDYRTLIHAVADLTVDLCIAADSGWHRKELDIKSDPLPGNVTLQSFGTYMRLKDLYSRALFIVVPLYPSSYACGYAVILEAMAMGRAVIATRTESYSDFIIDGVTGFYVRPCDPSDLRDKIQYLLSHPDRAKCMGEKARQIVEGQFSLQAYCMRIKAGLSMA